MKPPLAMPSQRFADGIRKLGFRKWYERELLSSHGYMVLAILSVVAMIASFEAFAGGTFNEKIIDVLFVILTGAIALWALRRYLFLSMHAEEMANQASCGDCGTYGRFKVVGEGRGPHETHVCCTKCAHEWTINS